MLVALRSAGTSKDSPQQVTVRWPAVLVTSQAPLWWVDVLPLANIHCTDPSFRCRRTVPAPMTLRRTSRSSTCSTCDVTGSQTCTSPATPKHWLSTRDRTAPGSGATPFAKGCALGIASCGWGCSGGRPSRWGMGRAMVTLGSGLPVVEGAAAERPPSVTAVPGFTDCLRWCSSWCSCPSAIIVDASPSSPSTMVRGGAAEAS
mmetsp:Transcript_110438/g.191364  ORF Transcript_110438/g.191364 Transcript_110438/m.191364 type:complete len:203 (-) Transcript_110438:476-1084(-)